MHFWNPNIAWNICIFTSPTFMLIMLDCTFLAFGLFDFASNCILHCKHSVNCILYIALTIKTCNSVSVVRTYYCVH